MSAPSIRLAPANTMQPQSAPMPIEQAQRWNSSYDNEWLEPVVSVFLTRPAYIRVCVHACSASIEVGGALIGEYSADPRTGEQYVIIKHVLPARHTRQGAVYLTFTQDSLVDLHDQIDKRFPGERIVGWYHTHPQMGVFLSHYDTWLHSHFFPEPWQVALVVEPFSSIAGFFIRQNDGTLDPTRYFGFYEMDGAEGHSIVRWHNLQQAETKPMTEEVKSPEVKLVETGPKETQSAEVRVKTDKPKEAKAQEVKLKEIKPKEESKGGNNP
jgi:proteasome lid subunit RPN8/RPN11